MALSAGKHVEKLAGCNVYPELIIDQGSAKEELDKVARYDNHTRIYHFPERMYWADEEELAFDLLFDGYHLGLQNMDIFFNNYFDQIGMACNCHHDFGYFCVFEFGKGVEIRDFEFDHIHAIHEQGDMIWDHDHRTQLPEMLRVPTFYAGPLAACPQDNHEGGCAEIDDTEYFPEFLSNWETNT